MTTKAKFLERFRAGFDNDKSADLSMHDHGVFIVERAIHDSFGDASEDERARITEKDVEGLRRLFELSVVGARRAFDALLEDAKGEGVAALELIEQMNAIRLQFNRDIEESFIKTLSRVPIGDS